MSTKTTFKRVALVAVAALGFGMLSAVPSSAGVITTVTGITAGTSSPARLGVAATNTLTVTSSATLASGNNIAVYAKVTSAPAGSAFATQQYSGASFVDGVQATGTPNKAVLNITEGTNVSTTDGGSFGTAVPATSDSSTVSALWTAGTTYGTTVPAKVSLTADVAGTYTVLVGVSAASATAAGAAYAAGDKTTTITFTVAGAPASIALASVAGSVIGGGTYGKVFSVTLKDAAGAATVLGANEAITVAETSAGTVTTGLGDYSAASEITTLTSAMISGGVYYIAVSARGTISTAGTGTLTVTGSGLLPATLTTNIATATVKGTTPTATAIAPEADETCAVATATVAARLSADYGTNCSSSLWTVTATNTSLTATLNGAMDITLPSGIRYSTYYTVPVATTNAAGSTVNTTSTDVTISTPVALADTSVLTVAIPASDAFDETISYTTAAAKTTSVIVPAANIVSATAATNALTVKSTDQYGEGLQYQAVTVTVTGRNTVTAKALGVTDVNGHLTFSHTDAGTTGTSDSVVFTVGSVAQATAFTITYGTVTVGTITITGGNTTASVANATSSTSAIEADDTPESAVVGGTVTVKDANGSLLAGVPVTFTVDKDGAAILSTKKTVYTGSAGTAATSVYAWKAGTYVVTATAGGKSTTASYTFGNSRAADARVLSATAEGGLVTAKVVDRFGNPVSGVTVYVSKTSGTGFFGTGVTKTSSTTGTDGTVDFAVTGTADIKVSTLDYAAVPGTNAAGQTCALAGNIDCAVGATAAEAFTATTAGTATVAEENVGSTFAPAGVSSVTVSVNNNAAADNAQAATDAASEATDAANAATDAANAAAEAADAATAAAQDAADAVAALSAQVSTMMASLKAQLTALTNLVIKIQKKVKA
jgi:hypothetical protein